MYLVFVFQSIEEANTGLFYTLEIERNVSPEVNQACVREAKSFVLQLQVRLHQTRY